MNPSAKRIHRFFRPGFSLLELLVVIAILAILISLLLAGVQKIRESANRLRCTNNLKQVSLACHSFNDAENRLPYSYWGTFGGVAYGAGRDSRAWSWLAVLLPHLEEPNLHALTGLPRRLLSDSDAAARPVRVFLCPSDGSASLSPRSDAGNLFGFPVGNTSYKGVAGANWGDDYDQFQALKGPIPTDWRNAGTNGYSDGQNFGDGLLYRTNLGRPVALGQIRDGASNTLLIGEDVPEQNSWCAWPYANTAHGTCAIPPNVRRPNSSVPYPPGNWENTSGFRSRHPGGLNFAFADGSVRFIRDNIDLPLYRALATQAGGEVASPP